MAKPPTGAGANRIAFLLACHLEAFAPATRVHILTVADTLDGGAVLPGFQLLRTDRFRSH